LPVFVAEKIRELVLQDVRLDGDIESAVLAEAFKAIRDLVSPQESSCCSETSAV
jgi:hypothetical protein